MAIEENDDHQLQLYGIVLLVITSAVVWLRNTWEDKQFKEKRDDQGFTGEDRHRLKNWEKINGGDASEDPSAFVDQTLQFFMQIGVTHRQTFENRRYQIIQFGVGCAAYHKRFSQARRIIGYDYSEVSKNVASSAGVQVRAFNLNAINHAHQLTYEKQLKEDLSFLSDILCIRVLEYLTPEAVGLLMLTLVKHAQPGSRFYFAFLSFPTDQVGPQGTTIAYALKRSKITSFFSDNNAFKIQNLAASQNETKCPFYPNGTTVEHVLIENIMPRPG